MYSYFKIQFFIQYLSLAAAIEHAYYYMYYSYLAFLPKPKYKIELGKQSIYRLDVSLALETIFNFEW